MKNLSIIIVAILISSCSQKTAFTSGLQNKYNFSEAQLKKVQFYTSGEIILVQTKQDGNVKIFDGKLVIINSKDMEKIIIPKNTKCVLEEVVDSHKLIVSFEFGDGKILLFGNNSDGCFSLMSKDWINGIATIHYANKNYVTQNGNIFLTIEARKLNKLKAKERIVKGRAI